MAEYGNSSLHMRGFVCVLKHSCLSPLRMCLKIENIIIKINRKLFQMQNSQRPKMSYRHICFANRKRDCKIFSFNFPKTRNETKWGALSFTKKMRYKKKNIALNIRENLWIIKWLIHHQYVYYNKSTDTT